MNRDFVADSGSPVPDRIPADLVMRYGREARRRVRHRRSRLYGSARNAQSSMRRLSRRALASPFGRRDTWLVTLIVFGCSIIAVAGIGALAYSLVLWPGVGAAMVASTVALLTMSYVAAGRLVRRQRQREELETAG
jgi:hypothetical protein